MNRKQVLASILEAADECDARGLFAEASELTEVGRRLAQWDDDFYEPFERDDDYNVHEENELARDRFIDENDENGGSYGNEADAMSAIRNAQAEYGNEPYVMLIDYDGEDDRGTTYDIMPLSKYEHQGHWMQLYKDVQPGTHEELAPYLRDFETETPLGMELDGGFDDFGME